MVSVPGLVPGDRKPPLLIVAVLVEDAAKMLPVPPSVAPEFTVTPVVPDSAPVTSIVPADTVVAPLGPAVRPAAPGVAPCWVRVFDSFRGPPPPLVSACDAPPMAPLIVRLV